LICSIVWRGRFALERPDVAPWVRVIAGFVGFFVVARISGQRE
jgi:hypothetical protein